MSKHSGRKTITIALIVFSIFAFIVSACSTADPNVVATAVAQTQTAMPTTAAINTPVPPMHKAPNMPSMPAGLTSAQQLGYGLVGKLPDNSYKFEGDYFPPTNDALTYCQNNPTATYDFAGDYTANGEKFTAQCSHVLAGFANIKHTWEELAAVPTAAPTQAPSATPMPATATPIVQLPSPTAGVMTFLPTATIAPADAGQTVYDQVVALCAGGMPYAQIGNITVPCDGKVLPRATVSTVASTGTYDPTADWVNLPHKCPTDGEMFAAHGFDASGVKAVQSGQGIPWEGCKWQVQAVGIGTYRQPLVKGYQYTYTDATGKIIVSYGDGSVVEAWGATVAYMGNYTSPDQAWRRNPLDLMIREYNFGISKDPSYPSYPGNLMLGSDWKQPDPKAVCPSTPVEAAAILGGDNYRHWTAPDWSGGAWVFNSKGDGFHHFSLPKNGGYFDIWVAGTGAVSVHENDPHDYLGTLNFEEGSYHCPGN